MLPLDRGSAVEAHRSRTIIGAEVSRKVHLFALFRLFPLLLVATLLTSRFLTILVMCSLRRWCLRLRLRLPCHVLRDHFTELR